VSKHDVLIIGGGPGGYVAAIKAAQQGLNVGLIEKEAIGGVCLNWGCIPTKALLKSAKVYSMFEHAKDYGISVDGSFSMDMKKMIKRKDRVVKKLTGGVKYLLKNNGVTVYDGFAEVKDAHTVTVGDETVETKKLIIATGASPLIPPIDGLKEAYENGDVLTSKEILDLTEQPEKLTIIGGGVIGVEFATIFNALGTEVTILEREEDILLGVDQELKEMFKKKLKKDKINILTGATVSKVEKNTITYQTEDGEASVETSITLLSAGMKANTKGLEALDLKMKQNGIETNHYMQTSVSDVYAIGDVTGEYMLAHVASKEGLVAVDHILGVSHKMDYTKVPSGIYTFPEIAQVGLTEEQAKAQEIDYKVSTFPLSANGKALGEGETIGMAKMIADKKYNQIIGVHILSQNATEMISEAVLGMNLEATAEDFIHAIHPHPTLSEMLHETAHGIKDKPIHI